MAGGCMLYQCANCKVYFMTKERAENHTCVDNMGDSSIQETDTENTLTQCSTCDGWFTSKEDYDKHSCSRSTGAHVLQSDESQDRGTTNMHQSSNWGRAETLLLIDEYIKCKEKVDNGTLRKKQLWQKISEKLASETFNYTSDQVCSRWKTLVRSYKNVKDHNGKSGNTPKTQEYQSELDEIFEQDPCVTPTVTLSSSKRKNDDSRESGAESENDEGSTSTTPAPKRSKSSSRSSSKEMLTLMHSYMDDQAARRQEEIERRERMHRERIDTMKSLIDTMKEAYQSKK